MSEENNHIEQFLKKHLEVEQTSFMEEDWTKMEALLDAEGLGASTTDDGGIGIRRGLVILLLATSLAFILGWFLKDSFQSQSKDTTSNLGSQEVSLADEQSSQDSELIANKKAALIASKEAEENSTFRPVSSEENQTLDSDQPQKNLEGTSSKNPSSSTKSKVIISKSTNAKTADLYSEDNELIIKSTAENTSDSENKTNSTSSYVSSSSNRPLTKSNDKQGSLEGLFSFQSSKTEENSATLSEQVYFPIYSIESLDSESKAFIIPFSTPDSMRNYLWSRSLPDSSSSEVTQWNRIAIGLAYAPDFNSLNFKGKLRATNKVGLRIFWKPLNRFELQSGVFFNKKKYTSPGEEYHPPAGYWGQNTGGLVPTWVNGSCSVIDIPVTVGFDFIQSRKWNWKINGGLSNYFLLDEEYQYQFNQPNPTYSQGWKTDKNTTLMWSIMNASVAGEFLWRSKTSLVIEPFIQMPLQEIGWAQVSLYGYGVLFTVKQNLFTQTP